MKTLYLTLDFEHSSAGDLKGAIGNKTQDGWTFVSHSVYVFGGKIRYSIVFSKEVKGKHSAKNRLNCKHGKLISAQYRYPCAVCRNEKGIYVEWEKK